MQLFVNLLLAHIVSDFFLQSDKTCENKLKGFRSKHLYAHALLVGVVSYALSNAYATFLLYAVAIAATHFVIDYAKVWLTSRYAKEGLSLFLLDQALHVAVLLIASRLYLHFERWEQFAFLSGIWEHAPLYVCCLLLCAKPSNILIKAVLDKYKISLPKAAGKDLMKAGALIGTLERVIAMGLVVLGQYEAVGFIIAAKSIIRFKDYETAKTEYVLVGTLLSFGLALLFGIAIRMLTHD